jgi:hypothetical protein
MKTAKGPGEHRSPTNAYFTQYGSKNCSLRRNNRRAERRCRARKCAKLAKGRGVRRRPVLWQGPCNKGGVTYSAEVLSQLRSLNWLGQELRRLPKGSAEGARLHAQVDEVRARLPNSILGYHDRLTKSGGVSTAELAGHRCGACQVALPAGLLRDLRTAGHFGVCPACGVFLWDAAAHPRGTVAAGKPGGIREGQS